MASSKLAVLVIADGMRRDFINDQCTPFLMSLRKRALWCSRHRSVVPCVTRTAASSIATGCYPDKHELAGNKLCLRGPEGLIACDAGKPEFFRDALQMRGYVLARPTLAQLTAGIGGARIYGNASPGAAYVHDPLHCGYVFHRAASFAPGGKALDGEEALHVEASLEGDAAMTERFIKDLTQKAPPALAVLWLGHPDSTQHHHPMGSPEHMRAVHLTDQNIAAVADMVQKLRARGLDVLFMVGSDHGHETVSGSVDIEAQLIAHGLKQAPDSNDVLAAANGTAALIYMESPDSKALSLAEEFLKSAPWAQDVVARRDFAKWGICPADSLEFFVSLKAAPEELNSFGIAGCSLAAAGSGGGSIIGTGQHGGLGVHEQSPFLLIEHPNVAPFVEEGATDLTNIAPTILDFLGLDRASMDGVSLLHLSSYMEKTNV